jgi:hypothetical protein
MPSYVSAVESSNDSDYSEDENRRNNWCHG